MLKLLAFLFLTGIVAVSTLSAPYFKQALDDMEKHFKNDESATYDEQYF